MNMITKSADYVKGYVDCWCNIPATKVSVDYRNGYNAGSEAKRVLEEASFSTDTKAYPELAAAAR